MKVLIVGNPGIGDSSQLHLLEKLTEQGCEIVFVDREPVQQKRLDMAAFADDLVQSIQKEVIRHEIVVRRMDERMNLFPEKPNRAQRRAAARRGARKQG